MESSPGPNFPVTTGLFKTGRIPYITAMRLSQEYGPMSYCYTGANLSNVDEVMVINNCMLYMSSYVCVPHKYTNSTTFEFLINSNTWYNFSNSPSNLFETTHNGYYNQRYILLKNLSFDTTTYSTSSAYKGVFDAIFDTVSNRVRINQTLYSRDIYPYFAFTPFSYLLLTSDSMPSWQ